MATDGAIDVFQMDQYEDQFKHDDLIAHHLDLLYEKMLESNLLKVIHPFR